MPSPPTLAEAWRWWRFAAWLLATVVVLALPPADAHAGVGPPSGGSQPASPAVDAPDDALDQAQAVEAVSVDLVIHRGGERHPDGTAIRRGRARVDGVATYSLARPARAGERVTLLDFASSMPEEPTQLDEVALATYVDGPFEPGGITLSGSWDTRAVVRSGPRRDLVVTLDEGTTSFTLRYAIDVPHRYWPFGCVRERCSLSGAVAPLPSAPAEGGVYLPAGGRVVVASRWHVTAALASPGEVPPGAPVGRRALLPDEVLVVGDGERIAYPSVFFGPRWHTASSTHRGITFDVRTPRARPSGQVPYDTKLQLRADLVGVVLRAAGELVDLLDALGGDAITPDAIVVIQGPLRAQIAEAHPGVVIISDQAFELFPHERFRRFHEDAIARGLATALVERRLADADPSVGLWMSGAIAHATVGAWRAIRHSRDEYAHDILSRLTFVPAVDRFLYTQQASFSSAYFRGVEDEMPVRNHPRWFAHELPTGRRIHEKLVDLIGAARLDGVYRTMLRRPTADPQALCERAWERRLDWFFAQWLGPYPDVDYSIADVDSRRDGERWHHRIVIRKDSAVPLVEPVQLLAVERGGEAHYLVWNGELGESGALEGEPTIGDHVIELETANKLASVRLDPRSRNRQIARGRRTNVDPLFDDRKPASFRFLYTGVGLSIAASEFLGAATPTARFNAISGFALFESSLRRDLRRTGHVQIARDRETDVSVGLGSNLWFGRKVNRQRRRGRVRLFETVSLLNGRSLDPRGGVRVIESIAIADDTRGFGWWPERGRSIGLGVSARHTLRTSGLRDHRHDFVVVGDWVHLWRIAKDHVVATSVLAEVIVPLRGRPEYRGLGRVGGIGGLSGYSADEAFGLGIATAQAEYRHVFINDLRPNFAHVAWLRSIGGIAFVGASSASPCEKLGGWFGRGSWYGTVGYALTGYLSILGVTPQLVRVELAAPVVRYRGTQCLGNTLPDYLAEVQGVPDASALLPPVSFNVTFQQSF